MNRYKTLFMIFILLVPIAVLKGNTTDSTLVEDTVAIARIHTTAATLVEDTVAVTMIVRKPSEQTLEKYRQDKEYQYDAERPPENPTLWERFKLWLLRLIMQHPKAFSTGWDIFLYTFAGLALLYIIYRLVKSNRIGLFAAGSRNVSAASEVEENIHAMDFQTLLEESLAQRQYRRAIRLLYLQVLKEMTDRQIIEWKIDKTNRQYFREISSPPLRQPFEQLLLLFEYVWYGDFPADEALFARANELYSTFTLALKQEA